MPPIFSITVFISKEPLCRTTTRPIYSPCFFPFGTCANTISPVAKPCSLFVLLGNHSYQLVFFDAIHVHSIGYVKQSYLYRSRSTDCIEPVLLWNVQPYTILPCLSAGSGFNWKTKLFTLIIQTPTCCVYACSVFEWSLTLFLYLFYNFRFIL